MSFDEEELRRALDARSGEPGADYRSRVRQALASAPAPGMNWTAAVAVILVTLLTAGSVGVLVASRHGRPGLVASGPRITTPSPFAASTVQLSAPSSNVVWALVDNGSLFRSTDRGGHWEKRSLPSNFGIRPSITFIDANEGWLLAPGSPASQCQQAGAAVFHTTDGAASWSQLRIAGLEEAQCKETIYFADARHGFISAWDDNHQPSVYWSPDGTAWKKFTLPDPPDFKTLPGGFALRVEWMKKVGDTYYLEAYGEQGAGTPYPDVPHRQYIYTSNGSGAWAWRQKVPSRVLAIVTPSRWLEMDAPGQLAETVNGGQAIAPFASDLATDTPMAGASMVFADGQVGYVEAAASLQRTVDGGAHWTQVSTPWTGVTIHPPSASPSPSPITMPTSADLSAPSASIVWTLVGGARLFLSADSGRTWQERSVPHAPDGGSATEISFVDQSHGWLSTCTNSTTLLWRTTDGARTWNTVSSPFPPDQCVLGLTFVNGSRGFITERFDYSPPTIFTTPDGGEIWNGSSIENPPGFQPGQPGYEFFVTNIVSLGSVFYLAAQGTLAGTEMRWVFRSTDDGVSWKYIGTVPNAGGTLAFVTTTRWIQLVGPGQSVETTDAGKTWHPYASDYSQAAPVAPQVVFGSSSVGYASVRGAIQRTTDGGAHWGFIWTPGTQVSPSPSPGPIGMPAEVQVSAPSAFTIFALVNSSALYRSTDKGKTWVQKTLPPGGPGGRPVISFVDDYHGYVLFPGEPATQCQQAGASLYATSDSANTWELVSSVTSGNRPAQGLPFDQCKDYIYMLAPSWAYIAGHDTAHAPVVSRTEDGGRTWDQATLPDPPGFTTNGGGANLHVTQIKNFGTRMLLEASGTNEFGQERSFIYESTDGGATWSYLEPATGDEVFVTTTRWLRLAGSVHEETTDGGQTWDAFVTDYANPGAAQSTFVFVDASTGYGVAGGQIERTADGGVTWSLVKSTWP